MGADFRFHAAGKAALGPGPAAARAFGFALESAGAETSGVSIGRYKLLQKLGEGGFGVVWMADQQEPIRRRVAVKIIKIGMDTEEVIARFEAERQALALMEHPTIARVFDAGATESGRPYFAMELVRGLPITRFCDENRLAARARLRLFVTVCQAVQHAHQKGVIHRDLKPSNILVTLHDGVPVPKIIDFGIAKATSAQLTEKTLFTQFHAFLGTPAYTSPEQMEMSGLDLDTRSDIYSLGVLLYELLTGPPPFDSDTLVKSGLEAMRRTIREIDPPRPSQRLGTLSDVIRTSVAHQRSTDPAKLSLLLRGDLDWIAMRCLEKDRAQRYDSATSLAADIERHLNDATVEARPPSRLDQARKFARRHKLAVAATGAVAASLLAGLISTAVLLVHERAARDRAAAAEAKESALRRQAEAAGAAELKRAARTALELANRHLADGRVADGIAYLVHAARQDPRNATLAPRLAAVLTTHNFLLPQGAPFAAGSRVLAMRFTRDGRGIFSGTEDGGFHVLDAATGELRREFHLGRRVSLGGWEFARDHDAVVGVRFADNTLGVYETASGRPAFPPFPLDPHVWVHAEYLGLGHAVGLSPDGRWLFASSASEHWVWEAATGALRFNPRFTARITGSDISADGTRLALVVGNALHQWSLPAGVPLGAPLEVVPLPRPGGPPLRAQVQFSPDGRRCAVGEASAGIQVFDTATGAGRSTLQRPNESLISSSLVFATADRIFVKGNRASGSWDLTTGSFTVAPIPAGDGPLPVRFDRAGGRGLAISSDGLVRVFDSATGTLVAEPTWQQRTDFCAALSPDGTQVAIGTATGAVSRLRIGGGVARPLSLPRSLAMPMPAPFLPDAPSRLLWLTRDRATVLDVASGREIPGGFRYPSAILPPSEQDYNPPVRSDLKFMVVRAQRGGWQAWELGPGGITRVADLQGAPAGSGVVAFSASGDRVAITSTTVPHVLQVWNLRTGEPAGPAFSAPAGMVYLTPNFTPDGRQLALALADGPVLILDIATGRPATTVPTRPLAPNQTARFSPDGARLVTANIRSEIRLWNARSGEPISPLLPVMGSSGQGRFSPDGRWLITWGERATRLRDGTTGEAVGEPIPAGGKHVRFSADGGRIATAERAGSAQIWDVPSGEAITEPLPHGPLPAMLPEFSPDGRFLKTENSSFHLWSVPPPAPAGSAPPEWLLQLATICATRQVDETGHLADAGPASPRLAALHREIAALPAEAPFAAWGRWILDERGNRSIAPGFSLTPQEAEAITARFAAAAANSAP